MRIKHLPMVSVPRPCAVSWDAMSGTDKARLCAECGRHVHDLATMTNAEAEALLDCDNERVCVRLSRGPDGQVITTDNPARVKPRPWLPGVPVAALATLLAVANAHAAEPQGGLRGKLTIADIGDVATGAKVVARNLDSCEEFSTVARRDGTYQLPLPTGCYNVEYAEDGFDPVKLDDFQVGSIPVRMDVAFHVAVLGEQIVIGDVRTPRPSRCTTYRPSPPRNFVVRMITAPLRSVKRLLWRD